MKKLIIFIAGSGLAATLFIPRVAFAFDCDTKERTYTMDAASIPQSSSERALISSSFVTMCTGNATTWHMDAMRIENVTVGSAFINAGYNVTISLGSAAWQTPSAVKYSCIWPAVNTNYNCDPNAGLSHGSTRSIRIRVNRKANAAATATIPNNAIIAEVVAYQRSLGTWGGSNGWTKITLTYKLNGKLNIVVPTCDIKNFDSSVTLPGVKRADLVNHGTGRYTGATKDFSIDLDCTNTPEVSMKFDGTKMAGVTSEDVLANTSSGNNNVGIQLVYKNNAMKIGENIQVISAAGASEELKFNAYYYYKGGTIQSGPIKASSEFAFTYQ